VKLALALVALCVSVPLANEWRRIWKPKDMEESDRARALDDPKREVIQKRLARDSGMLRKLRAIKRRGDQLTKVYNGAKR
jgi:hypothetical protein